MAKSLKYRRLRALEERRYNNFDYINTQIKSKEFAWSSITPNIPGSVPEKMIYDYLVKLGLHFQFQYHLKDEPETYTAENRWIPDFILPEYDVIIEVYGVYWHSMPETEDKDQIKALYMLNKGYTRYMRGIPIYPTGGYQGKRLIVWTDMEIYLGVAQLFARDLPDIIFSPIRRGMPDQYLKDKEAELLRIERQKDAQAARRILPKIYPRKQNIVSKYKKHVNKISKKLHPGSVSRAL